MNLLRVTLGCICLALGILGIFLPLLPTTVFILMAAWLFAQSSPRLHRWLTEHPKLGPVISAWQNGEGLPKKSKLRAVLMIWFSMGISMLLISEVWAVVLLSCIGMAVSYYLWQLPTKEI